LVTRIWLIRRILRIMTNTRKIDLVHGELTESIIGAFYEV